MDKYASIGATDSGNARSRNESPEACGRTGLELRQIENWINKKNSAKVKRSAEIIPKRKDRPRKHPLSTKEQYEQEIVRL